MGNPVTRVTGPGFSGLWTGTYGTAVVEDGPEVVATLSDGTRLPL